jgi:tripartite-type tricarboxylate transporter receptor subunit TctC
MKKPAAFRPSNLRFRNRRTAIGALFGALAGAVLLNACGIATAQAQEWPQRPVRFILPFGAGSAADVVARVIGDELTTRWGKPVVVENRPGADGIVAINAVVSAKDDHVLLVSSTGSFLAHPYVHAKLDYDFERDLVPIAKIADTLLVVGAPKTLPANNLTEFVALARERSDINLAASPGITEFAVDAFLKAQNLKSVRVPYKELTGAARDLGEARIHFLLTSYAVVRPLVEAGNVKIIAAGTQKRSALTKDIPSITESGYPLLAPETSTAIFAGSSMAPPLRQKVAQDVLAVVDIPRIREKIALTGQDVAPLGPQDFAALVKRQFSQAEGIAKAAGISKPQ